MIPAPKNTAERNQLLFMLWLARQYPAVYNAYVARASGDPDTVLAGFWDSVSSGISKIGGAVSSIIEKAPELLKQYGTTREQLEQIKLNLARVKAGNPPLNPDGTPVTSAQTAATVPTTPSGQLLPVPTTGNLPPWALPLGLGVLFLWFLSRAR